MDAETLKALKGSIKKWEGIVDGTVADEGSDNCPLCKLFNDDQNPDALPECDGCPVKEKTGLLGCVGTPYLDFYDTVGFDGWPRTAEAKRLAIKELNFLKSLLPKRSRK